MVLEDAAGESSNASRGLFVPAPPLVSATTPVTPAGDARIGVRACPLEGCNIRPAQAAETSIGADLPCTLGPSSESLGTVVVLRERRVGSGVDECSLGGFE